MLGGQDQFPLDRLKIGERFIHAGLCRGLQAFLRQLVDAADGREIAGNSNPDADERSGSDHKGWNFFRQTHFREHSLPQTIRTPGPIVDPRLGLEKPTNS